MTCSSSLTRFLASTAVLGLFSCASAVRSVDLPAGTDPQVKLAETELRLNEDRAKQYDQLSPAHFKAALNALTEAHRKSEKGEPSTRILADVGQAMARLQLVEDNSQKGLATLGTVLSARASARSAKADTAVPQEFNSADEQLRSFGDDIEDNDYQADPAKISRLEGRYANLELLALKHTHLGGARALLEKSENSGAKSRAPETAGAARIQYDSAARSIEANRHNPEAYQPVVAQALKVAEKLDQVLKTVRESGSSEAVAVRIYDQKEQLAANQIALQTADLKAREAQSRDQIDRQDIKALQGQNQQYVDREALNQKIEAIKAEFTPAEAEVVRDGKKIIIRLKSMKFLTARFELTATSLDTLQKVKEMILAVPVSMVMVEGHTDSVGSEVKNRELSLKRAEAVRKYFVAEKVLSADKFEAKGVGYERPLTTNKTKEGRATNRRVDVVIETVSVM